MSTKDISSSSKDHKPLASLPNVVDPTSYKWHQIIRDKIGYLFFNIASICTDPACKLHEKVTFLKLSLKSDSKNQKLSEELKKLAKRTYLVEPEEPQKIHLFIEKKGDFKAFF